MCVCVFRVQEAEQAAKDREVRRQAHEERVAERAERARHATQHPKSPSDFSCQSYDNMFAGQDRGGIGDEHNHREKMSLRSASITSQDKHSDTTSMDRQSGKTRKVRGGGDDDVSGAQNESMMIIIVHESEGREETDEVQTPVTQKPRKSYP